MTHNVNIDDNRINFNNNIKKIHFSPRVLVYVNFKLGWNSLSFIMHVIDISYLLSDGIFFVWLEGEDKLLQFMKKLNEFHPSLKFTDEYSRTIVKFLDVIVEIDAGQPISSPTDCHQYLHYETSHPAHVKRSIVYTQGLRIKRICSRKEDFEKHLQDLSSWLRNRAYPTWLIEK